MKHFLAELPIEWFFLHTTYIYLELKIIVGVKNVRIPLGVTHTHEKGSVRVKMNNHISCTKSLTEEPKHISPGSSTREAEIKSAAFALSVKR